MLIIHGGGSTANAFRRGVLGTGRARFKVRARRQSPVRNVYDYMQALSEMKAGQEYEVEVVRDGRRLAMKITPAAGK